MRSNVRILVVMPETFLRNLMFFWLCILYRLFSSYRLNAHFLYSITIYMLIMCITTDDVTLTVAVEHNTWFDTGTNQGRGGTGGQICWETWTLRNWLFHFVFLTACRVHCHHSEGGNVNCRIYWYEVRDYHKEIPEDSIFMKWYAMSTGIYVLGFWRIILPSSLGSNSPKGERLDFSRALQSFETSVTTGWYGVTSQDTWLLKTYWCCELQKVYCFGVWLVVVHYFFRSPFHKFNFRGTKM